MPLEQFVLTIDPKLVEFKHFPEKAVFGSYKQNLEHFRVFFLFGGGLSFHRYAAFSSEDEAIAFIKEHSTDPEYKQHFGDLTQYIDQFELISLPKARKIRDVLERKILQQGKLNSRSDLQAAKQKVENWSSDVANYCFPYFYKDFESSLTKLISHDIDFVTNWLSGKKATGSLKIVKFKDVFTVSVSNCMDDLPNLIYSATEIATGDYNAFETRFGEEAQKYCDDFLNQCCECAIQTEVTVSEEISLGEYTTKCLPTEELEKRLDDLYSKISDLHAQTDQTLEDNFEELVLKAREYFAR